MILNEPVEEDSKKDSFKDNLSLTFSLCALVISLISLKLFDSDILRYVVFFLFIIIWYKRVRTFLLESVAFIRTFLSKQDKKRKNVLIIRDLNAEMIRLKDLLGGSGSYNFSSDVFPYCNLSFLESRCISTQKDVLIHFLGNENSLSSFGEEVRLLCLFQDLHASVLDVWRKCSLNNLGINNQSTNLDENLVIISQKEERIEQVRQQYNDVIGRMEAILGRFPNRGDLRLERLSQKKHH